jgi:tetratricopeptide (TPR) repeat protein
MELFRSLNNAFPDKDEGKSSLMKLVDCYFQKKEYKLAINELNNFIEDNPKEPKIRSIYFKTGLYALYDENLITAKENFNKIENEELNSAIPEYEKLPHKSPFLAGTFSAVLPGAGQIYTERYADGIMSFLFNGMFIWGAVESFQNGQNVTGGILTFFELGWYSGNIYNAVNNAHKFNKRQKTDFIEKLKDKYPAIKDISLNSSGLELDF